MCICQPYTLHADRLLFVGPTNVDIIEMHIEANRKAIRKTWAAKLFERLNLSWSCKI